MFNKFLIKLTQFEIFLRSNQSKITFPQEHVIPVNWIVTQ